MKTKLIKRITSCSLFACALVSLVAAMALGTSGVARAESRSASCSVSTLQGLYVFNAHGWNIEGRAVPKAILQGIHFNGDGTLVAPFVTLDVNGVIARASGVPGTYTVNADCTGTVGFGDPAGVIYDTFVQPDGSQVWMMQTYVGGTPSVFEGTATRVP